MAGIYIHIPFCTQKCHYCNFHFSTSFLNKKKLIKAVCKELTFQKEFLQEEEITTVYIGGGTPSLLTKEELQSLFETIWKHYPLKKEAEITLEANPENLSLKYLKMLKESPVNRLSIGVQSFFDEDLIFLNRSHKSKEAKQSIINAQEVGFKNLTIDLIYGIPTLTSQKWKSNLNQIKSLMLSHFSAYSLTVEKKTALHQFIKQGKYPPINNKKIANEFRELQKFAKNNKYIHYETSSFCKKNFLSKHNSSYWRGEKYLGVGPSAHSYNKTKRLWNISNNVKYISAISEGKIPQQEEKLTKTNQFNEYILTGLRTIWGCNYSFILDKFGERYLTHTMKQVSNVIDSGLAVEQKGKLTLTKKGMLFADLITHKFFYEDTN